MSVPAPNLRTQVRATIRRASLVARSTMLRLDEAALDELQRIYREARADIELTIAGGADGLGLLRLRVLGDLERQITARLGLLAEAQQRQLELDLAAAAELGVGQFADVISASARTRLADEALRFTIGFEAEDGLQLSDRLWRVNQTAKASVMEQLRRSISMGHGASEAAAEFMRRGAAVPEHLQSAVAQAGAGRAARQAADQLMQGPGNPYEQARRLFRTEINRAHGEAFRAGAFSIDDVVGVRFMLSPAHPEVDVCDMHAKVNRYGLGPGVYPKGKSPWPAHPNTLSFEEVVFADEVTDADRSGQEDRISWLRRQPESVRVSVLGAQAKARALEAGILREQQINTPWRVLRRRFDRQGVDLTPLEAPAAPAPLPVTPLGVAPLPHGPAGIPVSQAFEVRGRKRLVAETLTAINAVHGDGQLPQIPVVASRSRSALGTFVHDARMRPVRIELMSGPHPLMTLAHEIGHFLDFQAIGPAGRWGSHGASDLMADWTQAVEGTAAVRQLRGLLNGPDAIDGGNNLMAVVPKRFLGYLVSPHELWARTYAQYIATRSSNGDMLQELSVTLRQDHDAPAWLPTQWDPDDFEAVAAAIDALFIRLGWIRG